MDTIRCKCGQTFNEQTFVAHFPHCLQFKNAFRKFDNDLGNLLKEYSADPSNLPIIKILFTQYITVIDRKIRRAAGAGGGNPNPQPMHNPQPMPQPNQFAPNPQPQSQPMKGSQGSQGFPRNPAYDNPQPGSFAPQPGSFAPQPQINQFAPNPQPQPNPFMQNPSQPNMDPDIPVCQICSSPDINYLECVHTICGNCFLQYAQQDFYNMKCKVCHQLIGNEYKKMVLGEDQYNAIIKAFDDKSSSLFSEGLINCPGCNMQFLFEKGNHVDYKVRDDKNQVMSREACEDYAHNRARCPGCQAIFCAICKQNPYHLGFTCDQYKRRQVALKCRFCDTEITRANQGPDADVCNGQECLQKFSVACKKTLPCGHHCPGTINDACPPCIDQDCPSYQNYFDQNKDAYCGICYVEGLGASPIVTLSCNHFVHFICIKQRLEKKWVGPKITFNHCLCPSCNNWYDCSNPIINALVNQNKALYKDICEKAEKRLKFEGLDKDPKLTNPSSPWYGKNLEYALKRLSYYMCYKCQQPYFAGRRECGDGPNAGDNNPNRQYDPKDCICGKCCDLSGIAGKTNCEKHGKDFIEYKCRFCCKIASWFCWGTTHFCEDCHQRQCKGDYISKYSLDRLPKCNPATCEVGGKHPPNGNEYALGCSICRNYGENAKDF
ncbi:MAG: hypothetical protein MJ252_16460 [archaeon]|nr:hypothetical protein [archaeon]